MTYPRPEGYDARNKRESGPGGARTPPDLADQYEPGRRRVLSHTKARQLVRLRAFFVGMKRSDEMTTAELTAAIWWLRGEAPRW